MESLAYLNYDPQGLGAQYLEDLATGYWYSEVLFAAVEMDIFTLLAPLGMNAEDLSAALRVHTGSLNRYLSALSALGLVICHGGMWFNTAVSAAYLVSGKDNYQGDSILWRKALAAGWQDLRNCLIAGGRINYAADDGDEEQIVRRVRRYIKAMDCVAKTKITEILPIFESIPLPGKLLDAAAGSGAFAAGFLKQCAAASADLIDLAWVLDYAREMMADEGLAERAAFIPANLLEHWPVDDRKYELVILSNIMHVYSEKEITHILREASRCMADSGYLLIHDFFLRHFPAKAALFDLNMLVHTYNGKVFDDKWVTQQLSALDLVNTGLLPLATDTGVIVAAKSTARLRKLNTDKISLLQARLREQGLRVTLISPAKIHIAEYTQMKCRYGCGNYNIGCCPPHSPAPRQTADILAEYAQAFLLEGEPPTGSFQRQVLAAEKEAFKAGYHKALAFWAGPCSLCTSCKPGGPCRNPKDSRPSMEGSGMDVFATVREAGISLRILVQPNDYVKYFALLLLE